MILKNIFTSLFLLTLSLIHAQGIEESNVDFTAFQTVELNPSVLYDNITKEGKGTISLPLEAIGQSEFIYFEDNFLHSDLAAQLPSVKCYKISSAKHSAVQGRLLITPEEAYITLLTSQGLVSIYPKNEDYIIEKGINIEKRNGHICALHSSKEESEWLNKLNEFSKSMVSFSNGTHKRTYDMAVVCTGEFYELNGNADTPVLTKIAATVSSLNVIFENELAVKLQLLQPFMYTNSTTDVFIPDNSGGDNRPTQAGAAVHLNFDIDDYDIGHVFHQSIDDNDGWSSGGVARIASVCNPDISNNGPAKAKGWSGSYNTDGNSWINLVAHEIGHMYGATHTFNGSGDSCEDAISETSAYEIGSGTTIMAYQGICEDGQNITSGGVLDNYFHVHSLSQMVSFLNNLGGCADIEPLNNTPPTANANPCNENINIPKTTAFWLRGSAGDIENEDITFNWEQYDEDGAESPTQGFLGTTAGDSPIAPLFRSFPPSTVPERFFPTLSALGNGLSSDPFQALPNTPRTLHFQLTARDNNPTGGGIDTDELDVVISNSGPLTVSNILAVDAGIPFDINWNTGGSDDLCDQVRIQLSTDGGQSYPFHVADGIDYSAGTATITLPETFPSTIGARFMIACNDSECYTFFSVTNAPCTITSTCGAQTNYICDTEFETFEQGDPGLSLGLENFYGNTLTNYEETIGNQSTIGPVVITGQGGNGCVDLFNFFGESKNIVVDETGIYTFLVDFNSNGGTGIISIFDANTFDSETPCPSFVASSAISVGGSSFMPTGTATAQLEACKDYLIITTNNHPQPQLPINTVITDIIGPGNMIEKSSIIPIEYSSTFIAVNDQGIIEVVNATSDFSTVAGGLYDIYGVSYKSGGAEPPANVDPNSWIGKTILEIQSTDCVRLSNNKKQIEVEFSCRINTIDIVSIGDCDPVSNTYSLELTITYEMGPLTGNLVVNGNSFPVTSSPQTVTLLGQISDGMSKGVNVAFSDLPGCTLFIPDFYTAPENCCPIDFELGDNQELCEPEFVILDGGNDGVEYNWFMDGLPLEEEEGSTLIVTETGNYFLEVINMDGCSKFDIVDITIFESPIADLGEDKVVCEGEVIIIDSQSEATGIKWYRNDTELTGELDPTLLVTAGGTYIFEGTNDEGCTKSDTVEVDYTPKPVVDLGDNQSFCIGDDPYTIDAGSGNFTYEWSRNTVLIPTATESTLEVNQSGLYSVSVFSGADCFTTDEIEITFNQLPDVLAGEDRNVCIGNSTNLLSFINADSYEWFFMGSPFSDQSESPEVSEGGEYILIGTNDTGCQVSDTVLVTVVMPPMIDLGEDKVGCIGSEVPLSVDSLGLILWTLDDDPYSNNANIMVTEEGEYIVRIIAASGCAGTDTINIDFTPGPMLELGDDDGFCIGETFTISADTDGDNITWFLEGVEIMNETGFDLEVSTAGNYSALVQGTDGCEVEDAITIEERTNPSVDLGDNQIICDGESIVIPSGVEDVAYTWEYNGVFLSESSEVTAIEAGTYAITVTSMNGCTDSDEMDVIAGQSPTLMIEENYSICDGEEASIVANGNGDSFIWIVNTVELMDSDNMIMVSENATVKVTAISTEGCTTVDSTIVSKVASPTTDLGDDFSLCPGSNANLNAGMQDNYLWSTDETSSSINIVSIFPETETTASYSVTVTNVEGCTATDEIEITFLPIVMGDVQASAAGVCNGEPVLLTASGGTNYNWIDPNGTLSNILGPNATASPTETTTYQVVISDDCPNNEDMVSIEIEVFELGDEVSAGIDSCVVIGESIDLNAFGGIDYSWRANESFEGPTDIPNPTVRPSFETIYIVDITDNNGCIFTDSVTICILDDPLEDFIPVSVITPNGDGDNDELIFKGLEAFPDNIITIYNRWGYAVYEKKRYQTGDPLWKGENGGDLLPADTYYYILEFDGRVYKNSITIIR